MQALAYLPNRVRILNEHKDVRGRMRVKVDGRTMDVARIAVVGVGMAQRVGATADCESLLL
jgi:hypothetical protein